MIRTQMKQEILTFKIRSMISSYLGQSHSLQVILKPMALVITLKNCMGFPDIFASSKYTYITRIQYHSISKIKQSYIFMILLLFIDDVLK